VFAGTGQKGSNGKGCLVDQQFGFGRSSKQCDEVTEMARKKTFNEGWGQNEEKRIEEQQEGFVSQMTLSQPSVEQGGKEALWSWEDSTRKCVAKGGTNASSMKMLQESSEWSACQ
jgi:hypothetical protein